MLDVARTAIGVPDFRTRAREPANLRSEIVDGDTPAAGNIKNPGRGRLPGKEGIGGGNVLHVNKIARLPAIAVNGDWLVSYRPVNEDGNSGGILTAWILARADRKSTRLN